MTQNRYFTSLFGQTPLKNSIAMATPKVPGDQKLFERVCYMLKLKVTKFQLSIHNGFSAVLKKNSLGGGQIPPPPSVQNRVNRVFTISVLQLQLKAVYLTSWCRLVLIREINQKLIILIHVLTIDQLKHCNWHFCMHSACRQAK